MKIAISSMGKDLSSMLDVRFGRCSYFIIYDTEGGQVKVIENSGQMSSGGAGTAAAQLILDEDVEAVITGSMGPNAFSLFKNSDIKVYRSGSIEIEKAVELFKEGKLEEQTEAGPSHKGMNVGLGQGGSQGQDQGQGINPGLDLDPGRTQGIGQAQGRGQGRGQGQVQGQGRRQGKGFGGGR